MGRTRRTEEFVDCKGQVPRGIVVERGLRIVEDSLRSAPLGEPIRKSPQEWN